MHCGRPRPGIRVVRFFQVTENCDHWHETVGPGLEPEARRRRRSPGHGHGGASVSKVSWRRRRGRPELGPS
eukprot:2554112-Rhodomonas_salina.1